MARIIEGIAIVAAGIALAIFAPELLLTDIQFAALEFASTAAISIGASLTLGGIANALQAGPTAAFSIKQPSAARICVYGQMRVSGTIVYEATKTTSSNNTKNLNQVIVWAAHACQSIDAVYLDGRKAYLSGNSGNGGTYQDDSGNNYSFGPNDLSIYNSLGPSGGTFFSVLNTYDSQWDSTCTLNGLTCSYIRCGFDANKWSGAPAIQATIHGKNDILDPRTGTRGWTCNAALVIADFLANADWGPAFNYTGDIDQATLIAAANTCDEQVPLAAGAYESRYTINGVFDTNSTPGEILDALLLSCEGRASYWGGSWKIYPAAWYGSSLSFGMGDLIDGFSWTVTNKRREKSNRIRATYISPRYPYAIVGYDRDHKDSAIFDGQWQPADAPEYAQDAGHGYASDANLAQDGGEVLYTTASYRFTTSVATCQRLMKIRLLRNRQQGNGTLKMALSALQLRAESNFQFTFPALNFANKYLEVTNFQFAVKVDEEGEQAPFIYCQVDVNETDPSVYLWSTAEERTPDNTPSPTINTAVTSNVPPPTGLTLTSGTGTAVVGTDGIIIPRIEIQWLSPADPYVASGGYIEIQYQVNGAAAWTAAGHFSPLVNTYYLVGVVNGTAYNVQLRAVRANGAYSPWVVAGPELATATGSQVSYAHGVNALSNYGFELNVTNSPLQIDAWHVDINTNPAVWVVGNTTGNQRSGLKALLIGVNSNVSIPAGTQYDIRVFSSPVPISGSAPVFFGGWTNWLQNAAVPAGLGVICRVGVYFLDSSMNYLSEKFVDTTSAHSDFTLQQGSGVSPSTAVFMVAQCAAFIYNTTGAAISTPGGRIADMRWDDMSAGQQASASLLASQGSIIPTQGVVITTSFTKNSCTCSWAAQSIVIATGETITTNAGSVTFSGLSPSTTYYTYWYVRTSDGSVNCVNGSPPPTSPDPVSAMRAALDGCITIGTVSWTTLASTSTGTGGGGGGDTCPEAAELVEVQGRGQIAAGSVVAGDYLKGFSFLTDADVFRRVIAVRQEASAAWRDVDGHVVSPRETVYREGVWSPAYQVSNTVVTTVGRKILLSVEAGDDNELNYWLVSGTPLLIHNQRVYSC